MNENVKGMLWTAGAVVVGILVSKVIEKQLMPSASASTEENA